MRSPTASVCILFASALPGAEAQLKKNCLQLFGFCGGICVCATCARSATILRTEPTSNKRASKHLTESTLPRKLNKTSNKYRFGSQTASQNQPPEPHPARHFRQTKHFWPSDFQELVDQVVSSSGSRSSRFVSSSWSSRPARVQIGAEE